MATIEWGTDYWGDILSEPDEAHARAVAKKGNANLYTRQPGGTWEPEADRVITASDMNRTAWAKADPAGSASVREALDRMRAEGERHFNEQVAKVQEDTGSTVLEMLETMNELGLHQEAIRYERHQKECMLDSDGQEAAR